MKCTFQLKYLNFPLRDDRNDVKILINKKKS